MPEPLSDENRPARGRVMRDVVLVLALFVLGGVLAGLAWRWWWSPPSGVVLDGVWYVGPDRGFSATGLYVLLGTLAGLLLGATSAVVAARLPLLTLALVLLGSAVGAWLMAWSGSPGDPPDPRERAAHAADGTELRGTLEVSGWSPLVAWPAGALAGLCVVFVAVPDKPADDPRSVTVAG